MNGIILSISNIEIYVDQWTDGSPAWTHINIKDGERNLNLSMHPADYHVIADFLYSLKPQIIVEATKVRSP